MEKLYKGKYLIAKYDLQDRLIQVGTKPSEFGLKSYSGLKSAINKINSDAFNKQYRLFLIDCLETHDDIFAEEDKIFLQELDFQRESKRAIIQRYAKINNIHERTVYKRLNKGLLVFENGEIHGVVSTN